MKRWLKESPTPFWVLDLLTTEFHDLDGGELELFEDEERRTLLEEAEEKLTPGDGAEAANPELLAWIKERRAECDRPRKSPAGVGAARG